MKEHVIRAELLHTKFIAHHNFSLLAAERLSLLYGKMFPDSKIAKNFKCSRTKSTCILNGAMKPALKSSLVEYMMEGPFSLVKDEASDTAIKKMNALRALIFDVNKSKRVEFKFYDMCATSGEYCSKASTLFDAKDSSLTKEGLDWDNVASVGVDNKNSNSGNKNSVMSRVLEKKSAVLHSRLQLCYLAHLAAGKRRSAYSNVSGFACKEHQGDLYYFFKGSSRQKDILTEFLDLTGLDWENLFRYLKTR